MIVPDRIHAILNHSLFAMRGEGGVSAIFDEGETTKRANADKGVPILITPSREMAVVTRHEIGGPVEVRYWDRDGAMVDVSVDPGDKTNLGSFILSHARSPFQR